ncbi:MAG: hypothetical protein CK538_03685 [Opitutia bacterium]|nr:MAG: hypothetical protein CK538_03685 [Opitutae bacterium]
MSSCSILLVDNEEELRDLPRHVLERAGHLVTCAKHGIDASLAIIGGSLNVIVSNMLRPERGGFELIAESKEKIPTAKIVAISGGGLIGRDQYWPTARSFGADVRLRKPFAYHARLSAVERARAGRN